MDRQMGEWLYYNFAAGSFIQRNFVADFIQLKLNFIFKKQMVGLGATHSIYSSLESPWLTSYSSKLNFSRYLLRYNRKSVEVCIFRRGGLLWSQISDERGVAQQPLLMSENSSDCLFVWYQNIRSALFCFVTKHACDRRTDRQTESLQLIPP